MLGILLLIINNHRKFVETIKTVSYTAHDHHEAKKENKKYYSDGKGNYYDIKTGHPVANWYDTYTGHRGIIDMKTGRAIEDHIEMQIKDRTEDYFYGRFQDIKYRLDARKEALSKPHNVGDVVCYKVKDGLERGEYIIYYDNEVKHIIDKSVFETRLSYSPLVGWNLVKKYGFNEEEIYEYYSWKGDDIKYPLEIRPTPHF